MRTMLMLMAATAFLVAGAAEPDDPSWQRIASDQAGGTSTWVMTSGVYNPQRKKLELEVAPAEVKKAAVEYEIAVTPYDPKLKSHIASPDHPWGNFLVKVNGVVILDAPAASYISKGLHKIEFKPELLKEGTNVIELGWQKIEPSSGKVYGYIYFKADDTERLRAWRKLPKYTPEQFPNDDLYIRLLVRL